MKKLSRREALYGIVALPAFAGLLGSTTLLARANGSKAQFKYQAQPKGNLKCSKCKFFKPGKTQAANGTCSIVEGAISPNGWCIAFSAK